MNSDCVLFLVFNSVWAKNSVTIKCVRHGWVRAYHFETRTTKVFLFMGQTRYHAPDENSCLF